MTPTKEQLKELAKKHSANWYVSPVDEKVYHALNIEQLRALIQEVVGEPVGMFWTNGKGKWSQSTAECVIKGPTHPLYVITVDLSEAKKGND